jgi:hypothetical protein
MSNKKQNNYSSPEEFKWVQLNIDDLRWVKGGIMYQDATAEDEEEMDDGEDGVYS